MTAGKDDRLMVAVLGRRRFLAVVVGDILTAPFSLQAQPAGKVWRIGVLLLEPEAVSPAAERSPSGRLPRSRLRLGRNLTLEFRSAEGKLDHLAGVGSDLVKARVGLGDEPRAAPGPTSRGSPLAPELSGKRVEILREAVSNLTRVGVLVNSPNPVHAAVLKEVRTALEALRIEPYADPGGPGDRVKRASRGSSG